MDKDNLDKEETHCKELREYAKDWNIPYNIFLKTRRNIVETVLTLKGGTGTEFNYGINAQFPYSLHGEPGNYKAIDFSEGPFMSKGFKIDNLSLEYIDEFTNGDIALVFTKI